MRSQALRTATLRVRILEISLILLFFLLAGRAGWLSVVETRGGILGDDQSWRDLKFPGARGVILDRDRRELAISIQAPSVYVYPTELVDRKAVVAQLGKILERDPKALEKRIGDRSGFVYLARWVTRDQAEIIKKLKLPGVGLEHEPRRTYPAGPMAASLLGFVDIDGKGRRGVEQMMDSWLQGTSRRIHVGRDARGRLLVDESIDPRGTAGGDIALAIDLALQAKAESALVASISATAARGGVIVVVDPKTGDILTLAEAPGFDPNSFRDFPYKATRSRAFTDAVEPGSTFKAFLVAAALEAGALDAETIIDTGEGKIRVPGKSIEDKRKIGASDAAGVLRHSSNVGAVLIAQELGSERYRAALDRLGFGNNTRSGFPSESAGLMRSWKKWKPVDQANIAFGQGVNVTAIQLAMAVASLANDGELMRPRIVVAKRRATGTWESSPPISAGQAVDPEVARIVVEMLETTISAEGTGRKAALAGVRVAGKTGTAQLLEPNGSYSRNRHTAWFIGLVPADDPKAAIVVALDEPKQGGGGVVAAPLFAEVAAALLARHGIITEPQPIPAAPFQEPLMASTNEIAAPVSVGGSARSVAELEPVKAISHPAPTLPAVSTKPSATARAFQQPTVQHPTIQHPTMLIPDFQGTSLSSARSLASAESLKLQFSGSGRGRVISQEPAPGTIVAANQRTVVVSFSVHQGDG